jgi:hypothetical protein
MAAALPLLGGIRRERKVAWAVLIAAVAAYAGKTDDRQWANPATWLRGERWNDRPAPQPAGNGAHAKPATAGDRARRLARQMEARERDGTHQRPPDAIGGDELGGDDARLVSGAKRDG